MRPSPPPPLYSCRCQACDCTGSTTHASKVCQDCRDPELEHPGPPPGEGAPHYVVIDVIRGPDDDDPDGDGLPVPELDELVGAA